MATPQLSPGVLIREVDLTVNAVLRMSLTTSVQLLGPFENIGPINDFHRDFKRARSSSTLLELPSRRRIQYMWMSAETFLSYGGILKVVRVGGGALNNANAGVGLAFTTNARIDNLDDHEENHDMIKTFYKVSVTAPGEMDLRFV